MRIRAIAAAGFLAIASASSLACGPVPGVSGSVPRCETVPKVAADPALYRPAPIYVANEMPVDAVHEWAASKPAFEEIWIDRDHNGWVTVAFSRDAGARQAELAAAFPGAGVVAVAVPWTMRELEALKDRIVDAVKGGRVPLSGVGIDPVRGVVRLDTAVLSDDVHRQVDAIFGGTRTCIEGMDPADAPAQGPQQQSGPSWRLIADEDEVGDPYRTGIATDAASLARLWADVGLATPLPTVDFQADIVVWFGAVHGSSCPRLRLDDVRYDAERRVLHSSITSLDVGFCTADAIGHAYVVAVRRSMLPAGRFTIQLQAEAPPPGALDTEPTIVDADLSVPGSTVTDGQLVSPEPTAPNAFRVELGDYLEQDEARQYRMPIRCGVEWLGRWDSYDWRATNAGTAPWVPAAWQEAAGADDTVDVWLTLLVEPSARIEAKAAGVTVTYLPTHDTPPACP